MNFTTEFHNAMSAKHSSHKHCLTPSPAPSHVLCFPSQLLLVEPSQLLLVCHAVRGTSGLFKVHCRSSGWTTTSYQCTVLKHEATPLPVLPIALASNLIPGRKPGAALLHLRPEVAIAFWESHGRSLAISSDRMVIAACSLSQATSGETGPL